ncbi:MAG: hypothetical protein U0836_10175 [Pirellulales bacterium]
MEAIESLPLDLRACVTYAKTPEGALRIEANLLPADGADNRRMVTIRECGQDPNAIEIVDDATAMALLVPYNDGEEFRRSIQLAIIECHPDALEDRFAQLVVDLRSSESVEELTRLLQSLSNPSAIRIIEELIALRAAVEASTPSRAEKRRLLYRTNELVFLFARFLDSTDSQEPPT